MAEFDYSADDLFGNITLEILGEWGMGYTNHGRERTQCEDQSTQTWREEYSGVPLQPVICQMIPLFCSFQQRAVQNFLQWIIVYLLQRK